MALLADQSRVVDTQESNMSPTKQNPLKDKIFHTDIRITSVEDAPVGHGALPQNSQLVEQSSQNEEDKQNQERAAEMQTWWDEAIAKNMDLPDGYQNVAVLLIKWADELDDLKTRKEAKELEDVFRNLFHYDTLTIELNVSSKPQHQISSQISLFVEKHDGPNNLMIVYYTGHGLYHEAGKYLELTGSTKPSQGRGFQGDARANWNKAEEALRSDDIEGDVLTILDTCYSSNLQKTGKEDTRTFELLSACAFDTTTAGPGDNSFTRALIDALKKFVKENPDRSITTFHLNQQILLDPRRHDTPSQLWFRLKHHERHIRLAPLKPKIDHLGVRPLHPLPRGYLTLRFALRDESLNREQIEGLTKRLSQAFNHKLLIGLQRIDWMGLKPARTTHVGRVASAMNAFRKWRRVVLRKRQEKQARKPVDDVELPREMSVDPADSPTSSPTRKRSRDGDGFLPAPKRESLVVSNPHGNPPSPPVSDISRIEEVEFQ